MISCCLLLSACLLPMQIAFRHTRSYFFMRRRSRNSLALVLIPRPENGHLQTFLSPTPSHRPAHNPHVHRVRTRTYVRTLRSPSSRNVIRTPTSCICIPPTTSQSYNKRRINAHPNRYLQATCLSPKSHQKPKPKTAKTTPLQSPLPPAALSCRPVETPLQ